VSVVSDLGSLPYGNLSDEAISERTNVLLKVAQANGATHALLACNTACVQLIGDNETVLDGVTIPVINIISTTQSLIDRLHDPTVLCTAKTARSGVYQRAESIVVPCPRWAGAINDGHLDDHIVEFEIAAARGCFPSRLLVLACTHYPAWTSVLQDEGYVTVDPMAFVLEELRSSFAADRSDPVFLTSGSVSEAESLCDRLTGQKVTFVGF
jgi:glutamate racemase